MVFIHAFEAEKSSEEMGDTVVVTENDEQQDRTCLIIEHDVNDRYGDINYDGSVIIKGMLSGSITVKVQNDLEVMENVGDCWIECGGNVRFRKEFGGLGNGTLVAAGNVSVRNLVNQTIRATGDVCIEESSIGGIIKSQSTVMAPKLDVDGSTIEAYYKIEVGNVKNSEFSIAHLSVGARRHIIEKKEHVEKEIVQVEKNLIDVKQAIYKLVRVKIGKGSLPLEQENLLHKLQALHDGLPATLNTLQLEKEALLKDLTNTTRAIIVVHGTIYPQCVIDINGVKKILSEAVQEVVFEERAGKIEQHSL